MWKFGPRRICFVVRPDQEEIGIIVAQQIGVHLGIKKESESRICCFYNDEFISRRDVEHLGGKLNSIDFRTSARIMCYSFVFALFETSIFRASLHISHSILFFSRLLHEEKWKFTVHLKLK